MSHIEKDSEADSEQGLFMQSLEEFDVLKPFDMLRTITPVLTINPAIRNNPINTVIDSNIEITQFSRLIGDFKHAHME